MDPLSRLPLECLQHILGSLDHDDSLSSLANLLTMNKHIASAAVPFLYRDPYRLAFHQGKSRHLTRHKNMMYELLPRMLLGRLPVASLPKVLALALGTYSTNAATTTTTADPAEPSTTTANSSFDNLSHIRHFITPAQDLWEQSLLTTDLPLHQLAYI